MADKYNGDPNPLVLISWKESVEFYFKVFEVTQEADQILVVSIFLKEDAKE